MPNQTNQQDMQKQKLRSALQAMNKHDQWKKELGSPTVQAIESHSNTSLCLRALQTLQRGPDSIAFEQESAQINQRIKETISLCERTQEEAAELLLTNYLMACQNFHEGTETEQCLISEWEDAATAYPELHNDYLGRLELDSK